MIREPINQWQFGEIRKCVHKQANVESAMKIISKMKVSHQEVLKKILEKELKVLEKASHPNIEKVYELLHDEHNYYIVVKQT